MSLHNSSADWVSLPTDLPSNCYTNALTVNRRTAQKNSHTMIRCVPQRGWAAAALLLPSQSMISQAVFGYEGASIPKETDFSWAYKPS